MFVLQRRLRELSDSNLGLRTAILTVMFPRPVGKSGNNTFNCNMATASCFFPNLLFTTIPLLDGLQPKQLAPFICLDGFAGLLTLSMLKNTCHSENTTNTSRNILTCLKVGVLAPSCARRVFGELNLHLLQPSSVW